MRCKETLKPRIIRLFMSYFHKFATRAVRKLQSLLGVITLGARAIVINSKNQVLLVKHTYQPHWYLPGGGVKIGESVKTAVLRELREEVGLIAHEDPKLFGVYFHTYLSVNDYPVIFVIKNYSMVDAHSPEIEQIGWFDYEKLPELISSGTERRLSEYFSNTEQLDKW
jgi:ADP-ribose pyrophosphatase YjhB (NUDIX family)